MKKFIQKILNEEKRGEYILEIPNLMFIPNADLESLIGRNKAWYELLRLLNGKPFTFDDDLNLYNSYITSLGNLQSVNGYLNLFGCDQLTSLGNLQSVGGHLHITRTPISKKYSEEEIRQMVDVKGEIYF